MYRFTLSKFAQKTHFATAIPLLMAANSHGFQFYAGDVEGSFDSQLSMGSSWRMEKQAEQLLTQGNNEDGNANFKNGDAFSQIFKGTHDLSLRYENYGVFIRGKYWYDYALENNTVAYGHSPTATISGVAGPYGNKLTYNADQKLDDSGFNEYAQFSGAALLDAFVYGSFDLGEMPLDLRIGKQVVSWGESTFILGGINSINPIDVSAFRRPGAEIKEGLLPVNMVFASLGVTDNLSAEIFYQLEFQETVIPGCGTYFATNDYAPQGCEYALTAAGSLKRIADEKPKDDDQFGVAFRFVSEALGDTEFGVYAMNIHSRAPLVSGVLANPADYGPLVGTLVNAPYNMSPEQAGGIAKAAFTNYFVSYPEDIQLAGISFASNVGSMAVSGEISHKKDLPIQINSTQLITAALAGNTVSLAPLGMQSAELDADVTAAGAGILLGYRQFDVSQAQITGIKFFDRVAGANRLTVIAEAGYTFVHDFKEGAGEIRYGRSGIYDVPGNDTGFVTEASYGYRARLVADYTDVFAGVNLTPILAWSHDVKGYAPQPGGAFMEGQKSLGFTLKADYLTTYNASIAYTQFSGGDNSVIYDRDFASISVGMQF